MPRFEAPRLESVERAPPKGRMVGLGTNGAPLCSDDLAQTSFLFALCVCEDADFSGELVLTGIDGVSHASLGTNGMFALSADTTIDGSVVAAGGIASSGDHQVAGNVYAGDDVTLAGALRVGMDAQVAGDVLVAGVMSVDGTLTTPEDASVVGATASAFARADVDIADPCDCDSARLDMDALTADARATNDNDSGNGDAFDPAALSGAGDASVTLPSGRLFAEAVTRSGALTLHVTGPTILVVAEDVAASGRVEVVLDDPSASLDLFIGGALASSGALSVGSATAPHRVRVYVGGDEPFALSGDADLGALVSAPTADVAFSGDVTLAGALLARSVAVSGRLTIAYDAAVLDGATCTDEGSLPDETGTPGVDDDGDTSTTDTSSEPDEPVACASTADCGNQACVDGLCGSCSVDADCPLPLICASGTCVNLGG